MLNLFRNIAKFSFLALLSYPLFLVIAEVILPDAWSPNLTYHQGSTGHLWTRLREAERTGKVDVLILGSSHAYRGYDPRIFEAAGLKTFNLGLSAQTPIQAKVLIDRYLEQMDPEIIIYDVYAWSFEIDGVEAGLNLISNDDNDWNSVEMALDLNHLKVYNSLIYAFIGDLFQVEQGFEEPLVIDGNTYVPGGFVEREMSYYRHETFPPKEWDFREEQLLAFEEIMEQLRDDNRKVVLVNAPMTTDCYGSYRNNDIFDSLMREHGEYLNFNDPPFLQDSLHFYDSDHLNQRGVEIYNRKLLQVITAKQANRSL